MANPFADLYYQGVKAGVAYWDADRRLGVFEYTPKFVRRGARRLMWGFGKQSADSDPGAVSWIATVHGLTAQ